MWLYLEILPELSCGHPGSHYDHHPAMRTDKLKPAVSILANKPGESPNTLRGLSKTRGDLQEHTARTFGTRQLDS